MSILRKLADESLNTGAQALASGNLTAGVQIATSLFLEGKQRKDTSRSAKALLLRAQTDIYASRFADAAWHAERAASLFHTREEPILELQAMAMQSYALASMGRCEEALQVALRCRLMASELGIVDFEAMGSNYEGVAAFWSGDHLRSQQALRSAADQSMRDENPSTYLQSLLNWSFAEVLQLQRQSMQQPLWGGNPEAAEKVFTLLESLQTRYEQVDTKGLSQPERTIASVLGYFVSALVLTQIGERRAAAQFGQQMEESIGALPARHWLRALPWWLAAENARQLGRGELAAVFAKQMTLATSACRHRPMMALASRYQSPLPSGMSAR